jgi:hypothetical protein
MICVNSKRRASRQAFLPARRFVQAGVFLFVLAASSSLRADIVVNFDSLPAAGLSGGLSGPLVTDYLASFGITLSNVTPGTAVTVYDLSGSDDVIAPSPFNIIAQAGSLDPISYTLNFALPQDHFSMTRAGFHPITGLALPEWQASAFDAGGNLLGTVGEPASSIYSDVPAEIFTLLGPGIKSVRIASDNGHFAAFGSALLDDFTLSTAVPEPSSLVLAVLGCVAVFGHQAIKRRRLARSGTLKNE